MAHYHTPHDPAAAVQELSLHLTLLGTLCDPAAPIAGDERVMLGGLLQDLGKKLLDIIETVELAERPAPDTTRS